ncbi:MAG: hypothetical protein WA197_26300 [Candidatus Acidiferrales bacterium]
MKMMRNIVVALSLILLSAPMISGQDLSKYRTFSLGTSLAELSKQVGPYSHYTTLIHQRPAAIQELTFWTLHSSRSPVGAYPVSQVLFSFYNGELYRIVVTYDRNDTEGLTDDDMVQAVSVRYGTATRLYPEISFFPTNYLDGSTDKAILFFLTSAPDRSADRVIARWEDSQNSVNLFHSTSRNSFGLAISSKRLDAQAEAAIFEFEKLEKCEAPQVEIGRVKKEADDLETMRQTNLKAFQP